MRRAHPTEQAVGIDYYVSDADGVGGQLRAKNEHFRVRELERFSIEDIDASPDAYPHVVFRATLRGWDTNDFASALSDSLGVSRERVSWAGTKDKRAISTQLFSISNVEPSAIPSLDRTDIDVLGRAGRAIEFGDLVGNAFEIVVSDPVRPEHAESITNELAAFGGLGHDVDDAPSETATSPTGINSISVGIPNVFGQQRFGSRRPVTHEVGLAIVREDWKGAVLSYLGGSTDAEPDDTQAARRFVEETHDWEAALERFPSGLRYERALLSALDSVSGEPSEDAYRSALERLPSNLNRLFIHAAQSYAFNRMVSERLASGLPFDRPVEGDVVCFTDRSASDEVRVPDVDRLQRVNERRMRTVTRHCDRGNAFVTAPLVGTETKLADGEQGAIERSVLDDLDLEPTDFDLPEPYTSTGTRRAILARTDLEIDFDPLRFSFALPKGSYATAILREYLKVDPIHLG